MSDEFEDILPSEWGKWKIVSELGRGAYGSVYKAERRDAQVVTESAIKVVRIPSDHSERLDAITHAGSEKLAREYLRSCVENYANEIRTMYSLQGDSHIVSIQDHMIREDKDRLGWTIFIRMEYLQSFDDYLITHTMTESDIIALGMDICSALIKCEKIGILHRDIKPSNLFVTKTGEYKLGDFGVARYLNQLNPDYSSRGTFLYMAPEVSKSQDYGSCADQYSLGLILYKLANQNTEAFLDPNKPLTYFRDVEEAVTRRMRGEPLPPPCNASREFSNVILKACAYEPQNRYRNAAEMRDALEALRNPKTGGNNNVRREKGRRGRLDVKKAGAEKRESGKKKKILLWIFAPLAALLTIAGIIGGAEEKAPSDTTLSAPSEVVSEGQQAEESTESKSTSQSQTVGDIRTVLFSTPSDADILSDAEKIVRNLEYSDQPDETLFADSDQDYIQSVWKKVHGWTSESPFLLKKPVVTEVASRKDSYWLSVTAYRMGSSEPKDTLANYAVTSDSIDLFVTVRNGKMKITHDQDVIADLKDDQSALWPDEVRDEDDIRVIDESNRMYLNKKNSYVDHFVVQPKMIWKDESGRFFLGLWLANGGSSAEDVTSIEGSIRDRDQNAVLDFSVTGSMSVPAGENRLFSIPVRSVDLESTDWKHVQWTVKVNE